MMVGCTSVGLCDVWVVDSVVWVLLGSSLFGCWGTARLISKGRVAPGVECDCKGRDNLKRNEPRYNERTPSE